LESEPDESLLLSDKDVQLLGQEYEDGDHSVSLNDYILQAQLAKDEARHEADKVKVREQTLKEVGEWIEKNCGLVASDSSGFLVMPFEIDELKQGRMP
jgi:hypothetical protein